MQGPSFFRALPPYLGGKRRLSPLAFATLEAIFPRSAWHGATLLDPLCGGGAVALHAKALGFRVVAGDVATRAAVVARALIANSSVRLQEVDVVRLCEPSAGRDLPADITPVLTPLQAAWLGSAIRQAGTAGEPRRSLYLLVAITVALRWFPMSLPCATDARAAAEGDYDGISTRRLGHYLRARGGPTASLLRRVVQDVNQGVFGGTGVASQGDARALIAATDADVVYLDPPYPGTTRYDRAYAWLDRLLGDAPAAAPPPTLDELLAAARHIPLAVISFGGGGVQLTNLIDQVRRHRPVLSARAVPYPRLRAVAKESTNAQSQEFLVVAAR